MVLEKVIKDMFSRSEREQPEAGASDPAFAASEESKEGQGRFNADKSIPDLVEGARVTRGQEEKPVDMAATQGSAAATVKRTGMGQAAVTGAKEFESGTACARVSYRDRGSSPPSPRLSPQRGERSRLNQPAPVSCITVQNAHCTKPKALLTHPRTFFDLRCIRGAAGGFAPLPTPQRRRVEGTACRFHREWSWGSRCPLQPVLLACTACELA